MTLTRFGHAYTLLPPPPQNCACLILIRAVWEFSAQNENSRENSHHHKTAKFSISRNYAWPDVFSMGFFSFILLSENSRFYHFWLNKEKPVLFSTGCHSFSYPFNIKLKEKGTGRNLLTSEVSWNYCVKIKVVVIQKCWYLTASWDEKPKLITFANNACFVEHTALHWTHMPWSVESDWCGQRCKQHVAKALEKHCESWEMFGGFIWEVLREVWGFHSNIWSPVSNKPVLDTLVSSSLCLSYLI